MLQDLVGKVVFVTGSARRVGKAIAMEFAKQGSHLVIHHSNSDEAAHQTAREIREIGVEAMVIQGDHSQYADIQRNFDEVINHYGKLDVMVNSAAIFPKGDILDITEDEWQNVMNINLSAPFWCTQRAAQIMKEQHIQGSIINISDNSSERPWVERPHHSISKAGVNMLTYVAARSLARYQIRVNAIIPGPVLKSPSMDDHDWQTQVAQQLPLGRDGDPEDVARAAVFLAQNDFITGAILRVDGGEFLNDRQKD